MATLAAKRGTLKKKLTPSRTPFGRRKDAIKRKFGLDWDAYEQLHASQKGLCAICDKPLSLMGDEYLETAYVDHCHHTGLNRGLLCRVCNVGLGHFKDSRLHLKRAIEYLDKYETNC